MDEKSHKNPVFWDWLKNFTSRSQVTFFSISLLFQKVKSKCVHCALRKKSESQNISLFSSRIKVKAYSSHFSLLDRTPVLKPTVACFSHVLTFHNHISCQKGRKQCQHSTLHFFQDGDVNGMKSSSDPDVWFLENVEKQHEAENVWNKKVWLDFSVWSLRFLLWWSVRVRFLHVDTSPSQSCPAIGRHHMEWAQA